MHPWIPRYRFVLLALAGPALVLPIASTIAMAQSQSASLDALFAELKLARDEAAARAITNQIWLAWTTPEDPVLAEQMQSVLSLRQRADFSAVIALLDEIVVEYPDYAEAWNQRATVYYLLGNYEKSLADIDMVLRYEPRHFGALVGRAVIYKTQGKQDLALTDMATALAIHPYLAERALFPELKGLTQI